jgi:hypothetical protein
MFGRVNATPAGTTRAARGPAANVTLAKPASASARPGERHGGASGADLVYVIGPLAFDTADGYTGGVERTLQIFDTFEDADLADRAFYASLSPQERLDLLLELIASHDGHEDQDQQGLARVHRVTDLAQG